jgi:hypothetical protein
MNFEQISLSLRSFCSFGDEGLGTRSVVSGITGTERRFDSQTPVLHASRSHVTSTPLTST